MEDKEVLKSKDYTNLNKHYLKISLTDQCLSLIGFNTELLDNNLYQFSISSEEIKKNDKLEKFSINELYDKIIELIEKKKYLMNGDNNGIILSLFEGETFNTNKDLQFFLTKSIEDQRDTYEKGLIRIIRSLRKENAQKNQINVDKEASEIKKDKNSNNSEEAKIDKESYPKVELSNTFSNIISGYGGNSYNTIKRNYNENRVKIIAEFKLPKPVQQKNGEMIDPKISYFAIYDGHGGEKCCTFLHENLHNYIFNSKYFPLSTIEAIRTAYIQAEKDFSEKVIDPETGKLSDKSGSCSISALIMDDYCFITNLGDSRALYSYDSGTKLYQITRDHKPNDPIEKERIEKAGGKIHKGDTVKINGVMVKLDEKKLQPGVTIPYRLIPGNIAVRKF